MWQTIRDEWVRRPWWMNLMLLFCLYMTFIRLPFDLFFTPIEGDEEVWFGVVLRGVFAKVTEPRGSGAIGAMVATVFMVPTIALWRSRATFYRADTPLPIADQ